MKMTVRILAFCVLAHAVANPNDPAPIEKYSDKNIKTYQLDVPGRDPITIIESDPRSESRRRKWEEISINTDKDDIEIQNFIKDTNEENKYNRPRCFGPSCQEGFIESEGPQEGVEDYFMDNFDTRKDFRDVSKDRLEAINALAEKIKSDRLKGGHYNYATDEGEGEDEAKVQTSWNKLNIKQHKHPFDDKDGWVTLEPIAWSTSKISKWKPNVKKQKPSLWNKDEERFPDEESYPSFQSSNDHSHNYPQKRPSSNRPMYINNKLHVSPDYETEIPSRPTWNKPQSNTHYDFPTSWSQDEGRRPHKPNCESHENVHHDDSVYYGISDSIVTDVRPSNFPFEYEALHQGVVKKRPIRRPTQVVYAGTPDYESEHSSKPHFNDGQWVLLSTTKGYRNKKRQRSLNPSAEDNVDTSTITSHQAVALTVLPIENGRKNMTTSHGGMLEVEKTFKTVDESKRDMDRRHDLEVAASNIYKPPGSKVVRRKIMSNTSPDSSTLLAAVGAGMVPATMAMVVPMMLGKRRRRREIAPSGPLHINEMFNQ